MGARRWTRMLAMGAHASLQPALVGCAEDVTARPPPIELLGDGRVASVSDDQAYLAYYTAPETYGATIGVPWVRNMSTREALRIGDHAMGLSFGWEGSALFFDADPLPATNTAQDAPESAYGSFSMWTPELGLQLLSTNFEVFYRTTRDHSATLFFDNPKPSSVGEGNLRFFRRDECASMGCAVDLLAEHVEIAAATMSADARWAAYEVVTPDQTREFYLVEPGGVPKQIGATTIPQDVDDTPVRLDFSPDGSLLALVATMNGQPMQLEIVSTATGLPVAWGSQPPGTYCTGVNFGDDTTLFVELVDGSGQRAVYRSTANGMEHFVDATFFGLYHRRDDGHQWMIITTTDVALFDSDGPYDVALVDAAAPEASPIMEAKGVSWPLLDEPGDAGWFLADYDRSQGTGTLTSFALPGGETTSVASDVYVGSVSYARQTSNLVYMGYFGDFGWPIFVWNGAESVEIAQEAVNYVTAPNPPTIYYTNRDEDGFTMISCPLP